MNIEHLTKEEIQEEIDRIYRDFPVLKGFDPCVFCCSGCVYDELLHRYGEETAEAWDELDGYLFLLG